MLWIEDIDATAPFLTILKVDMAFLMDPYTAFSNARNEHESKGVAKNEKLEH
jgi:hypothetical protein